MVEFVDTRQYPRKKKAYGVKRVPTQIFYDGQGGELFRHSGFYSKDDILKKWGELGYSF